MTLDITNESRWFLPFKINRLVKRCKDIPDRIVITVVQYEYLHKHIEVFGGNDKVPAEFLYHAKNNIMEIIIK